LLIRFSNIKKLQSKNKPTAKKQEAYASISHAGFVYALSQIDSLRQTLYTSTEKA